MNTATVRSNAKTARILGIVGAFMLALAFAAVPLYRMFCEATGFAGTPERADRAPGAVPGQVKVQFDANVHPGLPWRFQPEQNYVNVAPGAQTKIFYSAQNLSARAITGQAVYNVSPDTVGKYFKKIQCFCFTEEKLGPHQSVEMPVDFFVDPRVGSDANTADVNHITLSYTFFPSRQPQGAADLARFDNPKPDPGAGRKLFATTCSACHAIDRNKVGPPLDGVVGRQAGSIAGYPYSSALAQSHVVWNPATLDKWLTNPRGFIPGATMPLSIPDEVRRRDIIAYLETLKPPG